MGGGKGWVVKFSSLSKKVCKTGMTSLFYHGSGSSHLGRKRDKPEGKSPTYRRRQRRKIEKPFADVLRLLSYLLWNFSTLYC